MKRAIGIDLVQKMNELEQDTQDIITNVQDTDELFYVYMGATDGSKKEQEIGSLLEIGDRLIRLRISALNSTLQDDSEWLINNTLDDMGDRAYVYEFTITRMRRLMREIAKGVEDRIYFQHYEEYSIVQLLVDLGRLLTYLEVTKMFLSDSILKED